MSKTFHFSLTYPTKPWQSGITFHFFSGQSLIELLIALGLASILLPAVLTGLVTSREGKAQEGQRLAATALLREAEEAVRSVRENSWANITSTGSPFHPQDNGSSWSLISGVETISGFTRQIDIANVNRGSNCNVATSGGTLDTDTKKITTSVSWIGPPSGNVTSTSYLANPASKPKRGMLVYGNGGTASDAISYRTLNPCDGTWSSAASTADIDGASVNKALRAAKLYSSATRNEKILITRHFISSNPSPCSQFIYAQVFNGSSWGNVIQLSCWRASTFLDVQNFDGTYLANGDFMVVYSDNQIIPKARLWNGASWGAQTSLTTLGTDNIPNFIVAKARPGTNEVMASFFTKRLDTITQYWNGSTWSTTTIHSTVAPVNSKRLIDFAWSPNTLNKGALIFSDSGTDTTLALRIWTADGTGSGFWGGIVNSAASGGRLGAMAIDGRKGADEFLACQKDANNDIYCVRGNTTPAWVTPANNILTATSQTGIQRSFDLAYESISGSLGLVVYSDNTATPKYRKYNPSTNAFDAAASSITIAGAGVLATVKLVPQPYTDDIMVLMGDAANDLRSVVWNGTSDALYSTPSGSALSAHGTNGSTTTDFWYDFAWDKY